MCSTMIRGSSVLVLHSLFAFGSVLAEYESAGCSDVGCGIPCYLRPAEDECHYTEHNPCDGGGVTVLDEQLWLLNNSLVRLEEKLIQKGIIPAGSTCHPLPLIDHGGVIYSDLLISVGVTAKYVCEEGYSLHGQSLYECAVDGVWFGNDTAEIPVCEESLIVCEPLVAIPFGHINYPETVDTALIQPGDVVTYNCDPPYILHGSEYRICMRNGTWSEKVPTCAEPVTNPEAGGHSDDNGRSNKNAIAAGVAVSAVIAILVLVCIGVFITIMIKKRREGYTKLKGGGGGTDPNSNTGERTLLTLSESTVKKKSHDSVPETSTLNLVEDLQADK